MGDRGEGVERGQGDQDQVGPGAGSRLFYPPGLSCSFGASNSEWRYNVKLLLRIILQLILKPTSWVVREGMSD